MHVLIGFLNMGERKLEENTFLVLLVVISLAQAWIVEPFFGAILWGIVAAILFTPLNRRLLRALPGKRNLAALITLLVIIMVVILPAIVITSFLVQEVATVYGSIRTGELNVGQYFRQFQALLPTWAANLLERFGLTDIDAVRERLSTGFTNSFQSLAGRALNIGQSAFGFFIALSVMLYLTFFLLRDGEALASRLDEAVPLRTEHRRALLTKFATVIRATIKGSVVVAILQGAIGGLVFWGLGIHGALLWGVLMAFLSLLPAIGTGLIWVPVAIYLLVTGAIWQGAVLVLCGIFVIGMVDNVLRPILVGRDTKMPDYVVLISTLGGIEIFGFNGFVIGPVIAAMFMAVWDIFILSRRDIAKTPAIATDGD